MEKINGVLTSVFYPLSTFEEYLLNIFVFSSLSYACGQFNSDSTYCLTLFKHFQWKIQEALYSYFMQKIKSMILNLLYIPQCY